MSGTAERRSLSIATIDGADPVLIDLGDVRTSSVEWADDSYVLVECHQVRRDWAKFSYNFTPRPDLRPRGRTEGVGAEQQPGKRADEGDPHPPDQRRHRKKPSPSSRGRTSPAARCRKVDLSNGRGSPISRDRSWGWALDTGGRPTRQALLEQHRLSSRFRPGAGWAGATVATLKDEDRRMGVLGYSDPEELRLLVGGGRTARPAAHPQDQAVRQHGHLPGRRGRGRARSTSSSTPSSATPWRSPR